MTTRAISTVVDVTVCLLFVGAAATMVLNGAAVEESMAENPAAERAALLGTTTASIEYSLVVPGDEPEWVANASARHRRTAHGTVASLLGDAALSRVTIDGERLSEAGHRFEQEVAAATESRLRGRSHRQYRRRDRQQTVRAAVRARWTPYRDAPVSGEFRVGERPPPDADVRAATLTVSSGMANVTGSARTAAETDGYDGVATVVARAVVGGLFPPDRTRLALRGDYPDDRLASARYQNAARLTGARLDVRSQSTAALNQNLTAALEEQIRRDMAARFDSPTEAADAVETETVRITVRTWSP